MVSPRPIVLAVANRRNAGCGLITRFWSSSVSRPETSSTRWITNITSGRPASYSSKHERDVVLQRPGQDAVAELGDLLAVLDDDRVLADQVDAADVAVEIDAHAGPVEARRDLLDMGRLAGAVIAGDHDAAVVGEAGQDRERGRRGRTGSPGRRRARARRPRNRPALPCRCRCRTPAGPTPSCRAGRRLLALRQSLLLRGLGMPKPDAVRLLRSGLRRRNLAEGHGSERPGRQIGRSIFQ